MSCGLHDAVALEARGTPCVLFGTVPFRHEAAEQARALGMPDHRMVQVTHPIQPLPSERITALADAAFDEAVAWLTSDPL